jgi:hypothetical protein
MCICKHSSLNSASKCVCSTSSRRTLNSDGSTGIMNHLQASTHILIIVVMIISIDLSSCMVNVTLCVTCHLQARRVTKWIRMTSCRLRPGTLSVDRVISSTTKFTTWKCPTPPPSSYVTLTLSASHCNNNIS